jgi:hypothetical protein
MDEQEEQEQPLTEAEIRVKALEEEFLPTKNEIKQMMLDIRALLMDAISPIRSSSGGGKSAK